MAGTMAVIVAMIATPTMAVLVGVALMQRSTHRLHRAPTHRSQERERDDGPPEHFHRREPSTVAW